MVLTSFSFLSIFLSVSYLLHMPIFVSREQFLLDDIPQMVVISLDYLLSTDRPVSKHPNILLTEDLIQKIDLFIFEVVLLIGGTVVVVG